MDKKEPYSGSHDDAVIDEGADEAQLGDDSEGTGLDDAKLFGDNAALVKGLDEALARIRVEVLRLSEKRGYNLQRWLDRKVQLVGEEKDFQPTERRHFRRGDLAHVEFGFNVGWELGGDHFSIVLYYNGKLAVVVPMTSKKEHTKTGLPFQVDLGEFFMEGTTSIAWVRQMRAVSSQRLQRVKGVPAKVKKVPAHLMDLIDDEVRKFTLRGELLNDLSQLLNGAIQGEVNRQTKNMERAAQKNTGVGALRPVNKPLLIPKNPAHMIPAALDPAVVQPPMTEPKPGRDLLSPLPKRVEPPTRPAIDPKLGQSSVGLPVRKPLLGPLPHSVEGDRD